MSRPDLLVAVVGTGTDIGKTWLAAELARMVQESGRAVAARKPVQSFEDADAGATDAEVLAAITGEDPAAICPGHRWYPVPMAPPMAADALGRPAATLGDLVAETAWPTPTVDVGILETVGGVRSPVAVDGDSRDLLRLVGPDRVVLVADAGLGTIDAVRLAHDALDEWPVTVFLNRFDGDAELHQRNLLWLVERDGMVVDHDPAALAGRLDGEGFSRRR